ncbi:plasma membrane ammonium transmembrane transporter Amt1 [Schizosaccharomyces pombe]|uniref:Ammonium transporter 1 n=1 Tax=Schizosaccharomyces pombe (strain 972 / ATCC 24843) TaxID=284812 RepID=AMT1_SCHPO|nr:ammonium transporter Amt1 [Schizosaccharomyces pombe]Q9C0V1.1 RecName: Full=Ammonium transporter 1 [Schizosaccharomyces pombe 972h-]CAC36934.1 ammonium transporter Amt1 [Schizosaccharomyces pombe]|eukprot:NP_588424.1 ammonium transporter Amt1 [Schizosaccharomyces pombe]
MSSTTDATPTPSGVNGGDSMTVNLNQFYNNGDVAWILTSTALVFIMIPGVGFFYSGLARRRSAISMLFLSMMSVAIVAFQWFFWGYSLTFSHEGGPYIGSLANFGLRQTLGRPSSGASSVPDILFCVFQGMFAAITPALAIGAAADRGRMFPCMVFMFLWTSIVYDPIAFWTWNPNGWLNKLGSYDFAGGSPVHISSGMAALAYSIVIGKRCDHGTTKYRPHNVPHVVLGTVFLWFGWFGFNGGSSAAANMRGVMAVVVTHLAASVGGIVWCVIDFAKNRHWSVVGFCEGAVAGLVAITPGSGFVPPWAAVVIGALGAVFCYAATYLKKIIRVDDALDIFAEHGVGGMVGNILTALFAADYIEALDGSGTAYTGGWITHHYIQLGYQLADTVSCAAYSFAVSCALLFVMNYIPGLSLRVSREDEVLGLDKIELGESAYYYKDSTDEPPPITTSGVQYTSPTVSDSASNEKEQEHRAQNEAQKEEEYRAESEAQAPAI